MYRAIMYAVLYVRNVADSKRRLTTEEAIPLKGNLGEKLLIMITLTSQVTLVILSAPFFNLSWFKQGCIGATNSQMELIP
jgi:hypothetical protein